ncbi:PREDICTED: uncharacterized protein LOC105812201, partial [Propithecus coquereli]|uniref:uncharacterized protein LOC105812201 n=1 Tax=Propithecus coquereli TaxID=379532 RepID=UPI00063F65C7
MAAPMVLGRMHAPQASQSWTNEDDVFYAYASVSPGAEHRGTTQLLRFQLAPIKKLEGSLQIHFLLSSLHPRSSFPGGAGRGEAGSGLLRGTWAGILMFRLCSVGWRSGPSPAGPGGPGRWLPAAVGDTDPQVGGRGRPSPNENISLLTSSPQHTARERSPCRVHPWIRTEGVPKGVRLGPRPALNPQPVSGIWPEALVAETRRLMPCTEQELRPPSLFAPSIPLSQPELEQQQRPLVHLAVRLATAARGATAAHLAL